MRPTHRPHRFRPCLETLEARELLSITKVLDLGTAAANHSESPLVLGVPAPGIAAGDSVIIELALEETYANFTQATLTAQATDSAGNAYHVDAQSAGTYLFSAHGVRPLPAGSTVTVTISVQGYTGRGVRPGWLAAAGGAAYAGLAAAGGLDRTSSASGYSYSNPATVSSGLTESTSQGDELLVGAITSSFGSGVYGAPAQPAGFTPGPGYIALPAASDGGITTVGPVYAERITLDTEYQTVTAVSHYQADGTVSAPTDRVNPQGPTWSAVLATYRALPASTAIVAVRGGPASTVFVITVDHALWRHDEAGWMQLGLAGSILSVSAAGQLASFPFVVATPAVVLFAMTADHTPFRYDNGSGWQRLGAAGTVSAISAGQDAFGRADLFAVCTDHALNQWTAAGWNASPIGAPGTVAQAVALSGGGAVVATVDDMLLRYDGHWTGTFPGSVHARTIDAWPAGPNPEIFINTLANALVSPTVAHSYTIIGNYDVAGISVGADTASQPAVFALTTADGFFEYDAGRWLPSLADAGTVLAFSAAANNRVYIVRSDGVIAYHEPAGWTALPSIPAS